MERLEPDDGKLSRPVLRGGRGGNVAPPLSAFGNSMGGSGSSANPFIWNGGSGYYSDAESGLQKVGARFYDPAVGRWISQDTLLVAGSAADSQAINRFAYCEENPVGQWDPSGHAGILTWLEYGLGVAAAVLVIDLVYEAWAHWMVDGTKKAAQQSKQNALNAHDARQFTLYEQAINGVSDNDVVSHPVSPQFLLEQQRIANSRMRHP